MKFTFRKKGEKYEYLNYLCSKNHLCDSVFILNFWRTIREYIRCMNLEYDFDGELYYWKRGRMGPRLFPGSQVDKN